MRPPDAAKGEKGIAWVTGASSGIGEALAMRLALDGWTVAVSARSKDKLEALETASADFDGLIVPAPVDITDLDAVIRTVSDLESRCGPIRLAVLNAGTYAPDGVKGFDSGRFMEVVDLNVGGTAKCLQALMPRMIKRKAGQIALVSSVAGYRGLPRSLSYGASKSALINLAEALKLQLDPHGVKVQLVSPGFVKTPLTDKNDFPMPFLMPVDDAVEALIRGLGSSRFEICFPWKFTFLMHFMEGLPYWLYFPLVKWITKGG